MRTCSPFRLLTWTQLSPRTGFTNAMSFVCITPRIHQRHPMWIFTDPAIGFPDPFAVATISGEQTQTTAVSKRTLCPYWNESFDLCATPSLKLEYGAC